MEIEKRIAMNKPSIYGLTLEQLTGWLGERGYSKFWATLVWEELYRRRVTDFERMTEVKPEIVQLLSEQFVMHTLSEHVKQESRDGTVKFLLRLQDGNLIETVLMRQKYGMSVCVTTQVGCNIGCSFCASGLIKKSRDLSAGEIVEQLMNVQLYLDQRGQDERVTHTVVMGIGEPLDNFEHVSNFVRIIKDHKGLAIGPKRITVSTSGLPEKIKEFADSDLQVHLAISLHAATNDLRTRIMKINRAFPIEQLMEAVDYYVERTKRRVMFEYILLKDVNDRREDAVELARLIAPRRGSSSINLIPYNPVDEHSQYQRSEQESIVAFYDILKKNGINCTVRLEHGTDIDAACGQLRSKQMKKDAADRKQVTAG